MDSFFFEHRDWFAKSIKQYQATAREQFHPESQEGFGEIQDTSVCVRIRPLTTREVADQHIAGALGFGKDVVNIYEPRRKINKKPDITKSSFTLDEVYGPDQSTKDLYDSRVDELVGCGLQGGTSMLLAYGQTGSGKTHTVTGLETMLVDKMIKAQASGKKEVRVCIFEVSGSRVLDLLNDRNPLAVQEDAFGTMQLSGILEYSPKTPAEYLDLINMAKELRTTAATNKNDESSRSHSICRMRIIDLQSETADEGSIMLIDLAGSEASSDTAQHSKERMSETREINKSLSVLKECITRRAQWSIARSETTAKPRHIHIPYRTNKLTQILKGAFDVNSAKACKTIVVACISPSILDVAHSKNTLRYAETLKIPIPQAKPMPFDKRIPITWSNKHVRDWIVETSGDPIINPNVVSPHENGTQMCRLDESEFIRRALLTKDVEYVQAKLLYHKLWALHIDSRALLSRPGGSIDDIGESLPKTDRAPKQIIRPGMFFTIKTGKSEPPHDIWMAMGEEKSEKSWTCAGVRCVDDPTYEGAHELLVASQTLVQTSDLTDEVELKYDTKTRFYYAQNTSEHGREEGEKKEG